MINFKRIFNIISLLLLIEAFFISLCIPFSIIYKSNDAISLLITAAITGFVGLVGYFFTRNAEKSIGKRDGYIIVTMVWIVFSIFGSLPFIISGSIPNITDAFFETMSGFTTTGASILNDIEAMPHGLLVWRSLTQWLGGMGIIVLSLAVLPILGIGGMQLFVAEVPGPTKEKLHPRVKETAKRLWGIYMLFTLAETILLMIGGMSFFDALNHSFTTMATGGYSTKQDSIAHFDSPFIHYVITLFMFLAGTNFVLSYFALHLRFDKIWKNEEFRFYFGFVAFFIVIVTIGLYLGGGIGLEKSFRDAAFQVVSIITTTGFITADYLTWAPVLTVSIFVMMFIGGSAGSTGGGVKVVRILLVLKNSYIELKRMLNPHAIIPVKFNNHVVSSQVTGNIFTFIMFYILILVFSVGVIAAMGYDLDTSFGAVASSIGNIGPGLGQVGPVENYAHLPAFGKWYLSFLMLLGRLELFTVLILFAPAFWRK
jgi:trk system potassium uptake protein